MIAAAFLAGAAAGLVARWRRGRHKLRCDARIGRLTDKERVVLNGCSVSPSARDLARRAHELRLAEIAEAAGVVESDPPVLRLAKLRQAEYHDQHCQGPYLICASCRAAVKVNTWVPAD